MGSLNIACELLILLNVVFEFLSIFILFVSELLIFLKCFLSIKEGKSSFLFPLESTSTGMGSAICDGCSLVVTFPYLSTSSPLLPLEVYHKD